MKEDELLNINKVCWYNKVSISEKKLDYPIPVNRIYYKVMVIHDCFFPPKKNCCEIVHTNNRTEYKHNLQNDTYFIRDSSSGYF